MRIITLIALLSTLAFFIEAQTCVGTFTINVIDSATQKPFGSKLEKDIWYVFNSPEEEFYNTANEVVTFAKVQDDPSFNIRHNEGQYRLFDITPNKDDIEFMGLCGLYLVQLELTRKKDTMRLGIYNIPAHQSFVIDSMQFKKGDYYLDLKADERLSEVTFDERGFFLFPPSFIEKFKKE